MKGQIFLLACVLILIGLLILRINTSPVYEQSKSNLYNHYYNLKNEFVKIVDKALLKQDPLASKLDDFISFSKQVLQEKGIQEDVDYDITEIGEKKVITIDLSLSSGDSYLNNTIIISRVVY